MARRGMSGALLLRSGRSELDFLLDLSRKDGVGSAFSLYDRTDKACGPWGNEVEEWHTLNNRTDPS